MVLGPNHPLVVALARLRDLVIARLKEAFARDEIDLEEFERRVAAAEAAEDRAALLRLTADLPSGLVEYRIPVRRWAFPKAPFWVGFRVPPGAALLAVCALWSLFCVLDFVRAVAAP